MNPEPNVTVVAADLFGRRVDIVIDGGTIASVSNHGSAPVRADVVIDAEGGAVVPGLHDHHIHLFATAAAAQSVVVGPPRVITIEQFAAALAAAATEPGTWIRAGGYHESVAGDLDREVLDRLCPSRPLRVQDRSGIRWTLNSAGLDALGDVDHPGIERDPAGRPTGRVRRADDLFRDLAPVVDDAALDRLCAELIGRGVTSVTDTTPYRHLAELRPLAGRALPVVATGGVELASARFPEGLGRGPVKVLLDEAALPDFADLVEWYRAAHAADRGLAVHCVDHSTLALALAAIDVAGSHPGDRIEHGSLISEAMIPQIAGRGLTVVTQPGLIAERGDRYLADVEDPGDLYRVASLRRAGIPVLLSTDAPYTTPDPWASMAAAVHRRTPSGQVIGQAERVSPEEALAMFAATSLITHPAPGRRGDLVVMDAPWSVTRSSLSVELVRATIIGGRIFEK